jgi:thiol-disulfide isomerase/thioredoxin
MYNIMKKLLLLIMAFLTLKAKAQNGYNIAITLTPLKNQYVYLAYHYGKVKALADSALLNNNSQAMLKGKKKLPGGIYFIVSPKKEILFELLLDKQQQFSIVADSANAYSNVKFVGSPENEQFRQYSTFVAEKGSAINSLAQQLLVKPAPADSTAVQQKIKTLNQAIQNYRADVEKKYPASLLTMLFKAMKEPVVPAQAVGKNDSSFAYNFYKKNYWQGVSFTDERMLRTPILEGKLDKYFKDIVAPVPDSIIKETDWMLAASKNNNEVYKYLLTYFVQQYINPQYMGQDAVFVHLFEKYINNHSEVNWFTEKYKKYVYDRAYSLMANLIGVQAQELTMVDSLQNPTNLYSVQAPFTVICFWDATCGHCKEMVPRLDSIYQAKWKKQGVKIYGVMTDGGKTAWLQFIAEHNLKDWVHVYQTEAQKDAAYAAGKASYKQLYDVYQTPVLYLLDKDKKIIAKKLDFLQIDNVLTLKMKQ